ncbi:MAG: GAF domain-containing protein [Anaerolineaceae bacterium]|nr:GAF domain-containing protein [Anaerolineaceae bacterium]
MDEELKKILIVDDDANLRKTLEEILRVNHFNPSGVSSGQDAIALTKENNYPVALIDLRLSDMPGLDVLRAIKEISSDSECIILTGFASTETAVQAANLGAYSYVQKPYDIDQLLMTINRALEKKETRHALTDSEERYRQLYDGAFDGIFATDLEGKILDFNPAFQKILNYSPAELKSFKFQDITPERYHNKEQKYIEQILERGYSDIYEKEYVDKDGKLVPVEISGYLTRDQKGKPEGMWAFVRDISERKKSEETLRRQLQEVTVLHEISSAGTKADSIDNLIERATQILGESIFSDYFGFNLYDKQKHWLYPHTSYRGMTADLLRAGSSANSGITGRACSTGRPQLVKAVLKDKDYLKFRDSTRSEIAVPIKVSGEIFGIINAESVEENHFKQEDLKLLIAIANQLATAIEKIQLQEKQKLRTRELTGLYETALATSIILDTNSLYEKFYEQVRVLFPLDAFLIARSRSLDDSIEIAFAIEKGKPLIELVGQKFEKNTGGLLGWMIQNKKPFLSLDITVDTLPVESPQIGKPTRAWLGVPLIVKGYAIGGISVQSFEANVFNENHKRLLESLAAQVAIALDNARLLEQTQEQINRLAALHDIDLVINSSLDLRVTLNILLDQVVEKLAIDAASVLLYNPRTQMLEYTAGRGFRTHSIEHYSLRMGEGISGQAAMERHLIQALNLDELDDSLAYANIMHTEGFSSYFSVPLIAKGQVKGVLDIFNRKPLNPDQDWFNFLETLGGQAAIAIDNTTLLEDLHRTNVELTLAYDTTLEGWSKALDLRDKETEGHTQRVTDLTVQIAQQIGIPEEDLIHIRRGALLHDIGKMGIPDRILLKPGPLDDKEWKVMKSHSALAYNLLYPITYLRPALDVPLYHHEKFDGSGYPNGLKGEQIPLAARIFAVVDVWDALTSDRPYRLAWSEKKALNHIKDQSGTHFDPRIVDIFLNLIQRELINGKVSQE